MASDAVKKVCLPRDAETRVLRPCQFLIKHTTVDGGLAGHEDMKTAAHSVPHSTAQAPVYLAPHRAHTAGRPFSLRANGSLQTTTPS